MPLYTLTQKAVADLLEIGRYTQKQWGAEQRNRYLSMIDSCFQEIAKNPLKGRDCSDIRMGYRKMKVGSHLIFYRQMENKDVQIVRVLHGRMDIETRLLSTQD
jgi:toxin ParE1/3/4